MVHDDTYFDGLGFDPEHLDSEHAEDSEPLAPPWRRSLLIGVAAITATAMLLVPLYNVITRGGQVADNGLEICGFDYCIVQEAAIAAGFSDEMSLLAHTFLSDEEAARLAASLLDHIGESDVSFVVVERLEGELKGRFDPVSRTIFVERPVRAWIVVHEVAHAEASGHGPEFQKVLFDLTEWLTSNRA